MGEILGLAASVTLLISAFVWTTRGWNTMQTSVSKTTNGWRAEVQGHACGSWQAFEKNLDEFGRWVEGQHWDGGSDEGEEGEAMAFQPQALNRALTDVRQEVAAQHKPPVGVCEVLEIGDHSLQVVPFDQGATAQIGIPNWTYRFIHREGAGWMEQ